MQADREDQDEQDADPERRGGLAEQHTGHDGAVGGPAPAHRGDGPGGQGDDEGDDERSGRQQEGGGDAVGEDRADRLVVEEGVAEVQARDAPQVVEVLGEQGAVEPQAVAQDAFLVGGGVRRQEYLHRVTGEPYEEERDGGGAQQDEQRGAEAGRGHAQDVKPFAAGRGGPFGVLAGGGEGQELAHRETSALAMSRTPAKPGVQRGLVLRA